MAFEASGVQLGQLPASPSSFGVRLPAQNCLHAAVPNYRRIVATAHDDQAVPLAAAVAALSPIRVPTRPPETALTMLPSFLKLKTKTGIPCSRH